MYDINGNKIVVAKPFLCVSHRGIYTSADENCLPAFVKAYKAGYDAFETDVRITSDGEYILYHDASISGLTIADNTYDDIKAVKENICKLDDLLLYCYKNRIKLVLDMKVLDANIAEHVCEYGMSGKVWYNINSSFDLITSILAIDPKAKFHIKMRTDNAYPSTTTPDNMVLTVSAENVSAYADNISYARKNGYDVYVWDISPTYEEASMNACADWYEPASDYESTFITNACTWVNS